MLHFSEFPTQNYKFDIVTKKTKKQEIEYYNTAFSFDIETTSFYYENGCSIIPKANETEKYNKAAVMYIWQFGVGDDVYFGRTWQDFKDFLMMLKEYFFLDTDRKIIIYVHNLAYEFQFLRKEFNITNMFARQERKPIHFTLNEVFEFKCSFMLSCSSLETIAKNLTSVNISKKIGDLDYRLYRNSSTPMTAAELGYCEYDIKILQYYISEEILLNENNILNIPLTKTGYVRRFCRNALKENNYKKYRMFIKDNSPETDEFILLNKIFQGGYTHANCNYVGLTLNDVSSIDFTSSYPSVMLRHKFPMRKFKKIDIIDYDTFTEFINKFPCIFEIMFTNIQAKTSHHIIQRAKCSVCTNGVFDNGRIMQADSIITYSNDVDFKCIQDFYTYDSITIKNFWYSKYEYLPKTIIKCILKLYNDKTLLKGVSGYEKEYLIKKGMLNSAYGMCVTNPCNDEISYSDGWQKYRNSIDECLKDNKYNYNQFLLYSWGVWVTSWARYELFNGIKNINEDVIYSDTDSIKFLNFEQHKEYINTYNKRVAKELKQCCDFYNIDFELTQPEKNGKKYPLGVWDIEKNYSKFKTLGAKRYCYQYNDGSVNLTVSGVNKKYAVPYMLSVCNNDDNKFFDMFNSNLKIPKGKTGKLTHTYIDNEIDVTLVDYNGNSEIEHIKSCIHLEDTEFTLQISTEFLSFLCDFVFDELGNNFSLGVKRDELAITFFDNFRNGV